MAPKISTPIKAAVVLLVAAFLGSVALASFGDFAPVEKAEMQKAYELSLAAAPDFAAIEEAEMQKAYDREREIACEALLATIHASTWFVPNPDFAAIEEAEMHKAYRLWISRALYA